MTADADRIPNGIRQDSNTYTDTRHATYISTPRHATSPSVETRHHVVQRVTRETAPIVAPSPSAFPDADDALRDMEPMSPRSALRLIPGGAA